MPKFRYTAINKQGKEIKGKQEAENVQDVLADIRHRGLFPVNVIPAGKSGFFIFFSRKLSVKQKIVTMGTRQLAILLGAGLPLVRALKVLEDQQPAGSWKKVLTGLVEVVEGGSSFSDALGRYSDVFSKLYINMVKAGEAAGTVDVMLGRLADYFEKSQKLRGKIISALVYPSLVLGMAFLILIGLMVFVVPKFSAMFKDMGVTLPAMTKLLIGTSSQMMTLKFWLILVGIAIFIRLVFKFVYKFKRGKYMLDTVKLHLPVVGKLINKVIISRFSRTLGTLVSSGVPILQAINNVKDTTDNEVMSRGLELVHNSVKEGESIVEPLAQCPVFDPVVVNMIAVGEEAGKLDEMLIKVADTYANEADVVIANLSSLLEPILIIILALIVGFIVISLFLPLVSLITALAQ